MCVFVCVFVFFFLECTYSTMNMPGVTWLQVIRDIIPQLVFNRFIVSFPLRTTGITGGHSKYDQILFGKNR